MPSEWKLKYAIRIRTRVMRLASAALDKCALKDARLVRVLPHMSESMCARIRAKSGFSLERRIHDASHRQRCRVLQHKLQVTCFMRCCAQHPYLSVSRRHGLRSPWRSPTARSWQAFEISTASNVPAAVLRATTTSCSSSLA